MGVRARRSLKSSLMVWRDTPNAAAKEVVFNPKSGRKSSRKISPGCVGGIFRFFVFVTVTLGTSMVIGYFNIVGIAIDETETDSPLVIDWNGMLPFSAAFKSVQPVTRWYAQVDKACCIVDIFQTPDRSFQQFGRQTFWFACYQKQLRFSISKCFYHMEYCNLSRDSCQY